MATLLDAKLFLGSYPTAMVKQAECPTGIVPLNRSSCHSLLRGLLGHQLGWLRIDPHAAI